MSGPILTRMEPDDFIQRYGIPGFPHLFVEGCYQDSASSFAKLYGWEVCDRRFSRGIDKWNRNHVAFRRTLGEVREWVRAGGPDLWDPEHRKTDRSWSPTPELLAPDDLAEDDLIEAEIVGLSNHAIRNEAKFRAGLILESVINAGWASDDSVVEKYGQDDAERIGEEISAIAARFVKQSGRKT